MQVVFHYHRRIRLRQDRFFNKINKHNIATYREAYIYKTPHTRFAHSRTQEEEKRLFQIFYTIRSRHRYRNSEQFLFIAVMRIKRQIGTKRRIENEKQVVKYRSTEL